MVSVSDKASGGSGNAGMPGFPTSVHGIAALRARRRERTFGQDREHRRHKIGIGYRKNTAFAGFTAFSWLG
jgi:hypothetical protein